MNYDKLVSRLRCQMYGNCPACMNWYTEEVEPGLWEERCLSIDAADAIEKLQKDLERSKEYETFWEIEANEALRKFQVAIASKPRWIPVTERLSDSLQNVLVTDGKCVGMGWLDTYVRKDTGKILRDWFAPNTAVIENKITHWMPLPTPPKEETWFYPQVDGITPSLISPKEDEA